MEQIHLVRRVFILGLLLVSAACARHGGSTADTGATPAAMTEVRVNVTNHYSLSVEIYALGSGIRQRLGTVSPGMVRSFVLPPAMIGNGRVEILADVGPTDAPVRTGDLQLVPGDIVDFEITTPLMGSTARVRQP